MGPPKGFFASLWNFICFLPYFATLLLLGTVKGIVFCPLVCLIVTIGNSAVILGLWPLHVCWTYYSILRAKQLGPVMKLVLCLLLPAALVLWPVVVIVGSIVGGALYGFLSPIFATFEAVGEGKSNKLFCCFYDGTWETIKRSCTVVSDFTDFIYHSYFSIMDDLRQQGPPDGKSYEIRLCYLPGAVIAGLLGLLVDFPMVSLIAICKSPYMLFKGWHRLFHDLIGREGPFLECICVPFAGLAIILWPLAVSGAVLGSMASSIFLGAFAGVVVYQESSFWFGLCYIISSLALYDEYSNDVLDMPEGSCFPRPNYRKKSELSKTDSFTRPSSFRKLPLQLTSFSEPLVDLKPFELLNALFKKCQHHGEIFISEGLITQQDIRDAKTCKGSRVVSFGLPSYCILQLLLRSAKANIEGILMSDGTTELTSRNRPKDAFYDWFLDPFIIMKDQIKALNLSETEEGYLSKLVLLNGDPARLKSSNIGPPPESERRRAELDAIARRLHGLAKNVSRYPTSRRNYQILVRNLSEYLGKKNGDSITSSGSSTVRRSKSAFARVFSQKPFRNRTSYSDPDQEPQSVVTRNVEIV
ncbi:hypothetical protein K2173_013887 [Erythroxylum novogranatense]|uniref:Uncharacterized protein n=1 Tax=Erythroxylum novogranatense TaxID=1862640 RepID=A0AAV8SCU4_9ROSI|nr:hypothetical protein K2173_013887 [Erythroxylum novogranatense]